MEKLKKRYCTTCGRELPVEQCGYSSETGKPVFYHTCCPVKDCQHGDHKYRHWWSTTCTICGHKLPSIPCSF
jgi:hypothetical protein